MKDRIEIIAVNIASIYCAELKLATKLADAMRPYFQKNKKMRLSFTRARILTSEFVEAVFDILYKRHGVKVDKLLLLGSLVDEDKRYLQQKGFKASKAKYEAGKREEKTHADSMPGLPESPSQPDSH